MGIIFVSFEKIIANLPDVSFMGLPAFGFLKWALWRTMKNFRKSSKKVWNKIDTIGAKNSTIMEISYHYCSSQGSRHVTQSKNFKNIELGLELNCENCF